MFPESQDHQGIGVTTTDIGENLSLSLTILVRPLTTTEMQTLTLFDVILLSVHLPFLFPWLWYCDLQVHFTQVILILRHVHTIIMSFL